MFPHVRYLHTYTYLFHRDIKPDNILLDVHGHAHLTDFNVAIHYSDRRLHTSVAGSMAYMAPQVIGKKGYSWEIDWWSLGITAYELLFNKRPFDGKTADTMKHSILRDTLRFPENAQNICSQAGIQALKGVRCILKFCLTCSDKMLVYRARRAHTFGMQKGCTRDGRYPTTSLVRQYRLGCSGGEKSGTPVRS